MFNFNTPGGKKLEGGRRKTRSLERLVHGCESTHWSVILVSSLHSQQGTDEAARGVYTSGLGPGDGGPQTWEENIQSEQGFLQLKVCALAPSGSIYIWQIV